LASGLQSIFGGITKMCYRCALGVCRKLNIWPKFHHRSVKWWCLFLSAASF